MSAPSTQRAQGEPGARGAASVRSEPAAAGAAPRRRRWRWVLAGALAALTVLLAVTFGSGLRHNPSVVRSVLLDRRAPALAGRTLTGAPLDIAALRGKVLMVTVWASWCPSCRGEQPVLDAAQRQWGPAGLQIVGIDMTDQNSAAKAFLAQTGGMAFPSIADPNAKLAINWGAFGVPETYLVDRAGIVRAKVVGTVSEGWIQRNVVPLLRRS